MPRPAHNPSSDPLWCKAGPGAYSASRTTGKALCPAPLATDKLKRLRQLAERDPEMMGKEVRLSAMRMSSRLSAKSEVRYSVDETDLAIPAFVRKKGQEGKGRTQQPSNFPNTPI